MKTRRWFSLVTTVLLLAAFFPALPRAAEDSLRDELKDAEVGDHWIYDDWPTALEQAKKQKKPLFVLFR